MNIFLFQSEEFSRLYSCNKIHIEDVPLEKRQHFYKSIVLILLTIIYYILYVPCIISIYKHRENSCYKLLFFMSISDVCILWLLGFVHGYFSMIGAVYCSYPVFNFLAGVAVTAIWVAETAAEIILSLNRCLIILSRELEAKLFDGWLTYIWLFVALIYVSYWVFFVKPALFSSIHFSWSFNPYAGYIEDVNKTMFVQILVISSLNLVAGSVYVYMSYFVANDLLIYFAQFCWFHIHGFPPVIYLVLNQTIRDDCKQMILTIIGREQTFTIKKASALSTGAKISVKMNEATS